MPHAQKLSTLLISACNLNQRVADTLIPGITGITSSPTEPSPSPHSLPQPLRRTPEHTPKTSPLPRTPSLTQVFQAINQSALITRNLNDPVIPFLIGKYDPRDRHSLTPAISGRLDKVSYGVGIESDRILGGWILFCFDVVGWTWGVARFVRGDEAGDGKGMTR